MHWIWTIYHIADYFQVVVGPESVVHRKPDPEAVNKILMRLEIPASKALMIGDTRADILAGKAAKTVTCGVTYGFGSLEEIQRAEPNLIIDDIIELTGHIQ